MKRFISFLLFLVLLPVFSGAETLVTSFYPIWLLTLNLTAGLNHVHVRNLAAPTVGCLHDYQLQISDMKTLSEADAFLVNGAGMEAFLPEITRAFPDLPVFSASDGISFLSEDSAIQIGEAEEEEINSHIWLDPMRTIQMAENLADNLSGLFPGDRETIYANLESWRSRMENLDAQLQAGLKNLEKRDIVTFHEAFSYFAEAYHLNVVAVVNKEPGEILTPAKIAALVQKLQQLGNPPLFVEPQYTDLSAQTLARETGSAVWCLDPVVSGPETDVPLDYYETVMLKNMEILVSALSGHEAGH